VRKLRDSSRGPSPIPCVYMKASRHQRPRVPAPMQVEVQEEVRVGDAGGDAGIKYRKQESRGKLPQKGILQGELEYLWYR